MLHYPTPVALELYSYHRLNRKQVMWQSDKRDEEEGELTHSQDSREPDGATMSWQDCQHTSHSWLCVCVCVCVHMWVFVSEKIHVNFPVRACMSSACEITVRMQPRVRTVRVWDREDCAHKCKWERDRAYVSVNVLRLSLSWYHISLLCVHDLRCVCVFLCLRVPVRSFGTV